MSVILKSLMYIHICMTFVGKCVYTQVTIADKPNCRRILFSLCRGPCVEEGSYKNTVNVSINHALFNCFEQVGIQYWKNKWITVVKPLVSGENSTTINISSNETYSFQIFARDSQFSNLKYPRRRTRWPPK